MIRKFVFILFASISLFAQNSLNFEFDYARFAYSSDSTFIEFYYSFDQNDLTLIKSDEGLAVRAVLQIQIKDSVSNKYIVNNSWRIDNKIKDSSDLRQNKNLIGIIGFILPTGKFNCNISGIDAVDTLKRKEISDIILVEPLISKNISLSDIELASRISQENADKNSIFYKNTLEVIPNPTMIYGEGFPILFYYLELYNLSSADSEYALTLNATIFNSRGVKIYDKNKFITRSTNSRVDVGTINITKYPTDTYTLSMSLVDTSSNLGVSSAKRFFVYNPNIKDTVQFFSGGKDLLSSQFSVLSEEECDLMFERSKYIATNAEIDQYDKLGTLEGKREFIYNFWRKRDSNIATPENEYYNEYMERVRLSDERYGTLNRSGVKTDRGRILVTYGEPDEIDRYPNDIDKKPYEIWQYNQIEGGIIFIFGDVTGFSNYELLHSTKRGELRDDNWMRRIQTN